MSDKVLVTGATGFIGRALVKRLHAAGREVIALGSGDGDIRQRATLARYAGAGVCSVIHLAGRSYVPDSWADPAAFLETNFVGTVNALELCRATGASLVFLSTYVYGVPDRLPIDETAPVRPNNPYAQSKAAAEDICRFYAKHYSIPVTTLRLFNVYGPRQAAKFLIPTIVHQARNAREIRVRDLSPKRDFVYVDDVVSAIEKGMDARSELAVFNIASGISVSVGDIIQAVQSILGTHKPVVVEGNPRQNEIPDVIGDASRARSYLGWRPMVTLSEGISRIL